jgi:hypothetical protein
MTAAHARRNDWRSVPKRACIGAGGDEAAQQTLRPGDRADPGLVSVRGTDWPAPFRY